MFFRYFCLIVLSLIFDFCIAQEKEIIVPSSLAFSGGTEYGNFFRTNDPLKSYQRSDYMGYSFQVLKQTNGKKDWEKAYNYPQYGIGFFAFDFLKNKEMGSPFGIYGIYNGKLKQWGKLKWYHSVNFGISFNSNPFDEDHGYYNTSVGSKTNMFISLGTGMYYELGKHFDLGLNLKFNHLSNGSLKFPNKGLNTYAPQLSLVYYPERAVSHVRDTVFVDHKRYNTLEFSVFGGRKNIFYRGGQRDELRKRYDGFNYSVYGAEAFYMRQYSPKSAYGIGIGVTHDEQYNHTMYISDSTLYQKKRFSNDRLLFSVIPTYRLMIGKLYVNIGAGYYIFRKERKYDSPAFFQKIGLHYQITDRLFASFGINAYDLHIADYLEWRLGYTFSKKERR
ncbi:acyloxyacyl hydrolase [Chryseobacterium paludis]|uniref:acyloxyacyl hydrolase n=1 Tax=Chryseobacterium paludis TaxID=2956784 RepID=UPI0021BDF45E|nr:acyloxyacyl hydrolase [Chryseobacterium paludis]